MLTEERITAPRVSIAERLVPALACGMAAIAGVAGAWRMIMFFNALRNNENAGFNAFYRGLADVERLAGALLAFAAVLGIAGVAVSAGRMFMATRTASPSPLLMGAMGIIGLFSPVLVAACTGMLLSALRNPAQTGLAAVGETAANMLLVSVGTGLAALPVLLVLSVLPFRGPALEDAGSLSLAPDQGASLPAPVVPKRPATIIVIILVELAIAALAAWYLVEMFASRREMMLH